MKVDAYKEEHPNEALERALRSLDKLIELRTGPSVWSLAYQVDETLYLLGLDRLQVGVLESHKTMDALSNGPIELVKKLRRKVYEYLEMGE